VIERTTDFDGLLKWYLSVVESAENEDTKADRFRDFVRRAFPEIDVGSIGGFYPELEKYVKYWGHGRLIKGRPDSLFGNLLIEFENVLDDRHLEEAESQLRKYIAALWSLQAERGQKRGRFTALASDGLRFVVYKPRTLIVAGPVAVEQVLLEKIDQVDLRELTPTDAYNWLYRYIVLVASELRTVDPDEFAREFGVGSNVFRQVMELLRKGWEKVRDRASTLYEQWDSHLRIVYGTKVASEELYLKHTYLATLAKLVVYSSYSGGAVPISREELINILSGAIFRQWRIVNFIEEDLFSWVHKVDDGIEAARIIVSKLSQYDLSSISIDVFKELYQSLVDPEARHDLGEYYTPDWLAEMIIGDVLSDNPYKSVLDPACGSGTFLAMAIMYKKREIKELSPQQLLEHILENVVGIDIHPLALIIARATYLATLGRELLEMRERDLIIPVYLSDSIRLPQEKIVVHGGVPAYSIDVEQGIELVIPSNVAFNPAISDLAIDVVRDYAASIAEGVADSLDLFELHISSYGLRRYLQEGDVQALYYTAQNMAKLIKMGKDTIWGFILKNYYKPVFFSKRKFEAVVGNPPWLSYRYVKNVKYQEFLKNLIINEYGLLNSDKAELMTHMELATLFLVRSVDLYLKEGGVIGFVMPRSIFVADQHDNLRLGSLKKTKIGIKRLIDLENVNPLFNVPSCILYGVLGEETRYPINTTVINGYLERKNESLSQVLGKLNIRQTQYRLEKFGERSFLIEIGKKIEILSKIGRSEYYELFRQGATIVPKSIWCVEIIKHPKLGVDVRYPYVMTSKRAIEKAKAEYVGVKLSGNIESQFLYATVSGSELVPFGLTATYLTILPIEEYENRFRIIRKEEALERKYNGLANWLQRAESIWGRSRGEKAERMDVYQRLDYQKNLTLQNLKRKYKVLYNTSGTYLVSCVVENKPVILRIDGAKIRVKGIIADWKTYWMETDNEDEAHYIVAILNSPVIDEKIKPMQSKGAYGERDIVKKPLEFPIPRFDPSNSLHQRLSQLSRECHEKVRRILPALLDKYRSIGKIRSEIKNHLRKEIEEINELTKQVLGIT
jgi:methylase of polypeptide subunit release factors